MKNSMDDPRVSVFFADDVSMYGAIIIVCSVALVVFVLGLAAVYLTMCSQPDDTNQHESERFFRDPNHADGILCPFPSLKDRATLSLSVVVPAFDEENRLSPMLDECIEFLETRLESDRSSTYEVIIVDDGSKDRTSELGLKYTARWGADKIRVLTLAENRGKGGAVRLGMLKSRGKHLLFADADGATKFSELTKLETCMRNLAASKDSELSAAIVVGSRAHLQKESIATRSLFRTVLMYGFHSLVWLLCVRQIRDTQCGFKVLTRAAARLCFPNLHIHGWAFDVELLYIAETLRIPVEEVAVVWTEIEGSKVVPFWSWLQMGKDLFLLWLRYKVGIWCIDTKRKID